MKVLLLLLGSASADAGECVPCGAQQGTGGKRVPCGHRCEATNDPQVRSEACRQTAVQPAMTERWCLSARPCTLRACARLWGLEFPTLFEYTLARRGIRHKLTRPYTRHNGKVERGHREDQKRFYDAYSFYSLADFGGQRVAHQRRSNDLPMRPLGWLSPIEFFLKHAVQYV